VALAGVFIYSFSLIIGTSFADALVQRLELEPGHMDAAFWTTMVAALLLAAASFAAAGYAAEAVGEPRLAQVLPWLAPSLPLNAIATVQTALLRRAMRFRAVYHVGFSAFSRLQQQDRAVMAWVARTFLLLWGVGGRIDNTLLVAAVAAVGAITYAAAIAAAAPDLFRTAIRLPRFMAVKANAAVKSP